jgi:hypothetical protein
MDTWVQIAFSCAKRNTFSNCMRAHLCMPSPKATWNMDRNTLPPNKQNIDRARLPGLRQAGGRRHRYKHPVARSRSGSGRRGNKLAEVLTFCRLFKDARAGGQGCQIFWYNIPKRKICILNYHKQYQIARKYTKWPWNVPNGHTIYQPLYYKALQNVHKLGFWYENKPSGNPGWGANPGSF